MDSHVSKKAVIDVIDNFNVFESREDQIALERKIAELPSAEDEPFEWCTDCKEYDREAHCCHRFTKVIRNAVEDMQIVRCKDCIYADYMDDVKALWCSEGGRGKTVAPDDYCSYAERRWVTT